MCEQRVFVREQRVFVRELIQTLARFRIIVWCTCNNTEWIKKRRVRVIFVIVG